VVGNDALVPEGQRHARSAGRARHVQHVSREAPVAPLAARSHLHVAGIHRRFAAAARLLRLGPFSDPRGASVLPAGGRFSRHREPTRKTAKSPKKRSGRPPRGARESECALAAVDGTAGVWRPKRN
jgi:hypothetical protein